MALNALTLSITSGLQGSPFRSKINGTTAGSELTLRTTTAVIGGGVSNGFLEHPCLPYDGDNVFEVEERVPATGESRITRLLVGGVSLRSAQASATAALGVGRSPTRHRRAAVAQGDGSIAWSMIADDDLGGSASVVVSGGGGGAPAFIGGIEVGSVSSTGYTAGFRMIGGDDFDYTSLTELLLSGMSEGLYTPQRGTYAQADNGYRGSGGLGGVDADPFWTGHNDAGRGVAASSFSDLISVSGSELLLRQRPATAPEKLLFQDPTKLVAGSMISTPAAWCVTAPFIWEGYVAFQGNSDTHLTDWFINMGRMRDGGNLELDLEANTVPAGTGNGNDYRTNQVVWDYTNGTPSVVPAAAGGGGNIITPGTGFINFALKILADGTREYWVDGVCRARSNNANARALAKAFFRIWSNHVYQADAVNVTGYEDMRLQWHRIWVPDATGVLYKSLVPDQQLNVDFDTPFSIVLPTKTTVWGSEAPTEFLDALHLDENEPGINYLGLPPTTLLFPGSAYDGVTRTYSGRVNDRAGRKTLVRWTEGAGVACKVNRVHVNVGPNIKVPRQLTLKPGATFDLYAACDVGVLLPKTIAVIGLPAGASFSASTGLITVSGGAADASASVTINCINSKEQPATKTITFTIKAADTYRNW